MSRIPPHPSARVSRPGRTALRWSRCGLPLLALLPAAAWAGGSGLNVIVVVNQASSQSLAVGNRYCELRHVPPANLLRVHWTGSPIEWTRAEFDSVLASPVRTMLQQRGLTNQARVVALSMDIPYRVVEGADANSTTSALFYGFKTNNPLETSVCRLATNALSPFAYSETPFLPGAGGGEPSGLLAVMMTGETQAAVLHWLERSAASDGTFPPQPVLLARTSDPARSVRYLTSDNAAFDTRVHGAMTVLRTNSDQTFGLTNLLGMQTGLASLSLSSNTFVPGALADSLTSFGGMLFEQSGQTPLLAFLRAGAAGSYGTVTEPCNYLEKFPDPLVYFYQARGFNAAECYYLGLVSPYQGLIVAEPLAAPYARSGTGRWLNLDTNASLSGQAALALEFVAADATRPLAQVDLFLDGVWVQTLTNIAPAPGNVLGVTVAGFSTNCIVSSGATLASLAGELGARLNAASAESRVEAYVYGDRLELQSTDPQRVGSPLPLLTHQTAGAGTVLTTFIRAAQPHFLESEARGRRFWGVTGGAGAGDWLCLHVTLTNGTSVSLGVTNTAQPLDTADLTRQLLARVDGTPALQGADGLRASDLYVEAATNLQFSLEARSPGWPAARVEARLEASSNLVVSPSLAVRLDENLTDLRPRNHLYLTAGVTNLALEFTLDTTRFPDGHHELVAVASEGSHVAAPTRVAQRVRFRNTPLTASLISSASLGVAAVHETLRFMVTASTNTIQSIELLGTGGSLAATGHQASAEFAISGAMLGEGLHQFCALVTAENGARYRTEPWAIRLSEAPLTPPFEVRLSLPSPTLFWPGVAGVLYEIESAPEAGLAFQTQATLLATNTGPMHWVDTAPLAAQRFYRLRALASTNSPARATGLAGPRGQTRP